METRLLHGISFEREFLTWVEAGLDET